MRIKGKYVGLVEIDFDYKYENGMLPFETIKTKATCGELTEAIKEVINGEIVEDYAKVTVTQQYADMYEVDE